MDTTMFDSSQSTESSTSGSGNGGTNSSNSNTIIVSENGNEQQHNSNNNNNGNNNNEDTNGVNVDNGSTTNNINGVVLTNGKKRAITISSYQQNGTTVSTSKQPNGITDNATNEELNDSLCCPICLMTFKEPFITRCGHSFCYQCIMTQITDKPSCPMCQNYLTRDQIFPNFALNTMVEKISHSSLVMTPPIKQLQNTISSENISIQDINNMVAKLLEKKKILEQQDQRVEFDILLDFLQKTKEQKMDAYKQLKKQITLLDNDIQSIEKEKEKSNNNHTNLNLTSTTSTTTTTTTTTNNNNNNDTDIVNFVQQTKDSSKEDVNGKKESKMDNKKRKIDTHLDDLQDCYFSSYSEIENQNQNDNNIILTSSSSSLNLNSSSKIGKGLLNFSRNLSRFTRYNDFRVLSTLKYGDLFNTSSIVSSIEFDKDDEFFATAGVTKKIKVFEYAQVTARDVEVHAPVKEMVCRSKISCLSWNTYLKHQIASSDYEGIITLWDVNTGQELATMEEHEKRVWSVDFSRTDPTHFASGSDDTKVKLWSTTQKKALTTIESKANICCVKFNPSSSNLIAFGSADHHIHYYDLRAAQQPLSIFKGHRKAVSYVKFMNKDEIISASTDSTLKLWNVNQNESCVRTYSGHSNEKNFVGLAVNGDYICCGSENNGVFTYYKALSKPIVTYRFGANSGSGEDTDEDGTQFVSSVCWKKDSNVLLAANSQGNIKVLELY